MKNQGNVLRPTSRLEHPSKIIEPNTTTNILVVTFTAVSRASLRKQIIIEGHRDVRTN
jgi:hypothetical protein